ncbi:SIR2 family protein [Bacillus cereus group sp. MYBK249-1]|uniref:SIR2 family protein n=1 Tax=unclassified Bacillus cereus group TaxID=2750818 RepID=UPI003F791B52
MDNQLMSLSFSLEANKGVYALLLGSGISRAANIPTGWEIVKELCNRIMILEKENHNNPTQWYQEKYEQEPSYDKVIERLAKTPADRLGLLSEFLEPKQEDEEHIKKPTKAHRAIAKLVKNGYIKVIITTNFDRLMEQALEELNVDFQTLHDVSNISGIKPLVHANCTIVKVHGDYRDVRFKNVSQELEIYHEDLSKLLLRVFDEYGIITSGWSAEWDTALRNTINSVKGRRYSWYWHAFTDKLSEPAEELLKVRDGIKIIDSNGADSFFSALSENVESISKLKKTNHENIQVKINKLKKYITNNLEIELREMITEETQNLVLFIKSFTLPDNHTTKDKKEHIEIIKEKARTLAILLTILTYYSKTETHESIVCETLQRLTTAKNTTGTDFYRCCSKLPAVIGLYSTGIAATMKKNYKLLNRLFTEIRIRTHINRPENILEFTGSYGSIHITFNGLYEKEKYINPFEKMFVHPYMSEIYNTSKLTFDEQELDEYYDTFELLLSLKHRYLGSRSFPIGLFANKFDISHIQQFIKSGSEENESWPVLELFDNSVENFRNSLEKLIEFREKRSHFDIQGLLNYYPITIKSENL